MAATDHNTRNGALVKLSEIFAYEGEAPLEIEILPKALSGSSNEVLRDGQCIGVPNSILVQAFLAARSSLFDRSAKYVSNGRHQSLPDDFPHLITAVVLLFDPEHLTAANARKRHLMRLQPLSHPPASSSQDHVLKREIWLLDSFLTSPLPKHPKSPTLWSHRRWFLSEYWEAGSALLTLTPESKPGSKEAQHRDMRLISHELQVILKAAERHQHNYHAWNYLRTVMRHFLRSAHCSSQNLNAALHHCVQVIQPWCMRHPSDASGWSFLLFSLRLTKDSKLVRDTVREIVKRAVHLRLGGEALWRFLVQAVEEDDLVAWGPRIEVAEAIKAYMGELKRKAVRQEPAGRMMSAEERWLIEFIRRLQ